MAVNLTQSDFQQLVRIVQRQPSFASEGQRRNLVALAFGIGGRAEIILAQLDLSGNAMNAAITLVNFLIQYGQIERGVAALGVLIDQLLANMGLGDDADFLADVITRYKLVDKPPITPLAIPSNPSPVAGSGDKYVFISYARPERAIAEQVETYLKAAGFRTFRDMTDLRTGDLWDMKIEKALDETTHMVLLLSAASMPYRKEVYREWFDFDQQGKPLLPLYVQDCVLHSRLSAVNYIDARKDLTAALQKLVNDLNLT
jgi:hypothetical protein